MAHAAGRQGAEEAHRPQIVAVPVEGRVGNRLRHVDEGRKAHRRERAVLRQQLPDARLLADVADLEPMPARGRAPVGRDALAARPDPVDDNGRKPALGGDMAEVAADVAGPAGDNDRSRPHDARALLL
jgi:hypothetical protein